MTGDAVRADRRGRRRVHYVHSDRGRAVAGLQQRHRAHERRDPRVHRRRLHRRAGLADEHRRRRSTPSPTATCCTARSLPLARRDRRRRARRPALDIAAPERLAKGEGYKVFGMGANFAARRRLFDRDRLLRRDARRRRRRCGRRRTTTSPTGRTRRGRDPAAPEVHVRHDGRREAEDWPSAAASPTAPATARSTRSTCAAWTPTRCGCSPSSCSARRRSGRQVDAAARRPQDDQLPAGHADRDPRAASGSGWTAERACMSSRI